MHDSLGIITDPALFIYEMELLRDDPDTPVPLPAAGLMQTGTILLMHLRRRT